MLLALFIGSCVIFATLTIAGLLFGFADKILRLFTARPKDARTILALIAALCWILMVLTISIWIWALVFVALGIFDSLEPALYFALVSFTTVGYGDVVIGENWRLLAGMTATNGLLVFGLFTAFLVEVLDVLRRKPLR